jgi:hypothetical protein
MAAVKLAPASGKVTGTHNNIPLLVIPSAVTNVGTLTTAEANSVRFYADSAYVVELAREVVGADELHYKTGSSYSSSSESWMDWDGVRSDYAAGDTYGRNAVWSDYGGVYHLNDLNDSTSGGFNLTNVNSVTFTGGKIGDNATAGTPNTNKRLHYTLTGNPYGIASSDAFTMTAWMKANTTITSSPAFRKPFSLSIRTNSVYYQLLELWNSGTPTLTFGRTRYGSTEGNVTITHTMSTSVFAKYTLVYDGSNVIGYLNGSSQGSVAHTGNGITWSAQQSGLGIFATVVDLNGWSPTQADEVRVRKFTASADWEATEYQNQNDNGAFWVATPVGGGFTPSPLMHQMMMAGGVV